MEKNKKIIISVLIIIFAIALVYFGMGYMQKLEQQTFYDTIKNVSDLENETDIENDKIHKQTSASTEDVKKKEIDSINTTSEEIMILQDLKNKVSNESYLEYIDIQLDRLNSENQTYRIMLESTEVYEQYQSGKMTNSQALSLIHDKTDEMDTYIDKVKEAKVQSDTFLNKHTDMKDKFNQIGIDEDFLFNQIEEVNTENIK